jgi:N-acyl-L-homoserine lactone synthetase
MILVVTQAERRRHAELLAQMHRHRKRVFVDRFGWQLPLVNGELEVDQFDTDEAIYLLSLDNAGAVTGSLRLINSMAPHILGDLFPHLCEAPPPRDPRTWEVSRFCTDPALKDPRLARKHLLVGLVEFAVLYGIARFTCVSHMVGVEQLLAIGWDAAPLGLPQKEAGSVIGALEINITPETLKLLRHNAGFEYPVLRWELPHAA